MGGKKILLADDEQDILAVFKSLLCTNNYQVITAKDGVECVEKALKEKPDLILLDIRMPNKDGLRTLQALKSNDATSGIPVVMLTVSQTTTIMSDCLRLGAKDFIPKTLDSQEILKYVQKYAFARDNYENIRQPSSLRYSTKGNATDKMGNCWDFWKCETVLRNSCYVYQGGIGRSCWTASIKRNANSCLACSWFKKLHTSN